MRMQWQLRAAGVLTRGYAGTSRLNANREMFSCTGTHSRYGDDTAAAHISPGSVVCMSLHASCTSCVIVAVPVLQTHASASGKASPTRAAAAHNCYVCIEA